MADAVKRTADQQRARDKARRKAKADKAVRRRVTEPERRAAADVRRAVRNAAWEREQTALRKERAILLAEQRRILAEEEANRCTHPVYRRDLAEPVVEVVDPARPRRVVHLGGPNLGARSGLFFLLAMSLACQATPPFDPDDR